MTKPIQIVTPAPTPTRQRDAYAEARSLERRLRSLDASHAAHAVTTEEKKRALIAAASPAVRAMAAAAMGETGGGNNETHEESEA